MAQASSARDTTSLSSPTLSPCQDLMAASRSMEDCSKHALWHLRMQHKVCQREEEQLVNSWWMDIFMQGLPGERGGKSKKKKNVYKEATINKVFVSFLGLDFQVQCFGSEKEQNCPWGAKLPAFKAWRHLGNQSKPECVEDFNYSARSSKML